MRPEIVHFLQHVHDEKSMAFVLGNMKRDGLMTLFDYLALTEEETEARWHHAYDRLLNGK
ncbi:MULTISPECIES: hypothetical protein [unclassified Paenibacillus]|uniref:hypothetical protein n=1 Tax=unclassified Paenibacillus TaxID=185978 RepID=UPI001C110A63|nr:MULTISPECIES: hypothetical protein [unclassified Paenibacillus]MBU5441996.1 hypothetical protein [Paenibacillus sp. MSJ-34]CAH0118209.1 hypothetical protein PAE9249_00675 [Paenibacillus sp. CECT 9249]